MYGIVQMFVFLLTITNVLLLLETTSIGKKHVRNKILMNEQLLNVFHFRSRLYKKSTSNLYASNLIHQQSVVKIEIYTGIYSVYQIVRYEFI